ncbi:Uncharacterised protein [Legionella beliardensis]|uniref:Uncharacterized protein n=1 Tax=Legionella beliardensis TaxID=91822 RepID=A0A378JPC6_9GAMM|nr:Uncharacterised protein [Legionella beliardensis]
MYGPLALAIAKALTIKSDQHWNPLHMMAAQPAPSIESLLNLAKVNSDVDKAEFYALLKSYEINHLAEAKLH